MEKELLYYARFFVALYFGLRAFVKPEYLCDDSANKMVLLVIAWGGAAFMAGRIESWLNKGEKNGK